MTDAPVAVSLLLALLDGAMYANALRRNGKPARIRLPEDAGSREVLITAHLRSLPMELTFLAEGREPWRECVRSVVLAAICPAHDGNCGWVAIDLDASDHGQRGLADPPHASRVIAERAANAGLLEGLIVARSRRGKGRHVFLVLPQPASLDDAAVGLAGLIASASHVAASDVVDDEAPHAFRRVDGQIALPGQPGAIELLPHSTQKPAYGWSLALPAAGVFASHGGGIIVDPFTDKPIAVETVPSCHPHAWSCLVNESRAAISRKASCRRVNPPSPRSRDCFDQIDQRTRSFLDGQCPEGQRNRSAFAASANLLGWGFEEQQAWRLILRGAQSCGLPEREAKASFSSAAKSVQRRIRS